MAKTQNPSVSDFHFKEFSVLSPNDFVGGVQDKLLLYLIRALRKSLSQMEQYHPGFEGFFVLTGRRKKRVSHDTISFWLHSVITLAHASALEEDCRSLRVTAHKVRKVLTSLLFKRNCAVHQILKVVTWSAQFTFSAFYLRDVTHRPWIHFPLGLW